MKTAFITGANKGIGFETARQLLQQGYRVFIGSRDRKRGIEAVGKLISEGSVERARASLGEKTDTLDVLINNSGINGIEFDGDKPLMHTATETDVAKFREVFEVNVFGVVNVTQAFLDLLKRSDEPRIVNVSSSQGSLTLHSNPDFIHYRHKGVVYQSSKAALNMYTLVLAYELRDLPFKVNAVSPGSTKTDFNHQLGQGSVEDAARRIIKYATIGSDGPTGKFFSEDMNPETGEIPW
ncbi:MAG: short-chain dehydrogenase [Flavobacteriaceae bacterium]|nr:MAG: short-chain dehydrogenase [Flavobacteriaceae bacterium]